EITVIVVEGEEGGAKVQLFAGAVELPGSPVLLPITGDNALATQAINVCGVDFMRVTLNGSGAIDNIKIELEEELDGEACTPGFWKNLRRHLDEWVAAGYAPGQLFEPIFLRDVPGTPTLDDAVHANGGGVNKLTSTSSTASLTTRIAPSEADEPTGERSLA
ncbi:MAG: hypothetical protein ACE5IZ_02400, partial [Dehalococcoidia bacterium]